MRHLQILKVLNTVIFILIAAPATSAAKPLERSILLELNAGRRLSDIQKRPSPHGEYNYTSVYHTSKLHHQLKPLKSRHDTFIATRNQYPSRKTNIRAVATGIFGAGFLQFLIFMKKWMSNMFYELHHIYFLAGFAFLPFLWTINAVWFFREAFHKPEFEEQSQIKQYVVRSGIGAFLWTMIFVAWTCVFQINRAVWGELGDQLSFVIPRGIP